MIETPVRSLAESPGAFLTLYRLGEFGIRQNPPSPEFKQAGTVVDSHKHNFDHLTCVWGKIRIDVLDDDGNVVDSGVFGDDNPIALIRANTYHRLTLLEDGSQYRCIYLSREHDGSAPAASWHGNIEAFS